MLYLDKQVMSLALCTSQTRKIELTEQTMVGVLSNEHGKRREIHNPIWHLWNLSIRTIVHSKTSGLLKRGQIMNQCYIS